MLKSMSRIRQATTNPYKYAASWKKQTGKPVVGCMPMYFPEELIHASGALPIIIQKSQSLITLGSMHMDNYFCHFVRGTVDMIAKNFLNVLDLIVIPDTCVQQRGMAQVLRHMQSKLPVELVMFPIQIGDQSGFDQAVNCLNRFRNKLADLTGSRISDDNIEKSIRLYNEYRQLMEQIYDMRRQSVGRLSSRDILEIVQSSMIMSKEEHIEYLKNLIIELEKSNESGDNKIRICVSGHFCSSPPVELLEIIEEMEGIIVDDDLYIGYRYFAESDVKIGGPIEQLANRYVFRRIPTPTRFDPENDWREYLVKMVKNANAQGLIYLVPKYCDPLLIWFPDIKKKFKEENIPILMIETEHEGFSLAREKTRIRKLMEVIKGLNVNNFKY